MEDKRIKYWILYCELEPILNTTCTPFDYKLDSRVTPHWAKRLAMTTLLLFVQYHDVLTLVLACAMYMLCDSLDNFMRMSLVALWGFFTSHHIEEWRPNGVIVVTILFTTWYSLNNVTTKLISTIIVYPMINFYYDSWCTSWLHIRNRPPINA